MIRTQYFHCYGLGSIPGQGTKTLKAEQCGQKKNYSLILLGNPWKVELIKIYIAP